MRGTSSILGVSIPRMLNLIRRQVRRGMIDIPL